jgi:hypothetical protein
MSPDWNKDPQPVPYAKLSDPQSLNLYDYMEDNPLAGVDPNGHCSIGGQTYGFWFCLGHALGLAHTQHEQAQSFRRQLSQMHGFTINGQSPQDFVKSATDSQVIGAYHSVSAALANEISARTGNPWFANAIGAGGAAAGFKIRKAGLSGKEAASDIPSWAEGTAPMLNESGKQYATRLMNEKYGAGNWKSGPGTEFNRLQKYGDRAFEDPPKPAADVPDMPDGGVE